MHTCKQNAEIENGLCPPFITSFLKSLEVKWTPHNLYLWCSFCLCGVAKKNAQAFPSQGVSEPQSLCSVCAGGNACTEILADGFHLEALGNVGEELKVWEQLTTALIFAPSLLIQSVPLLEVILWGFFHVSPLRWTLLQLCFLLFGFHLGK